MPEGGKKSTKSQMIAVLVGLALVAFGLWELFDIVIPDRIWDAVEDLVFAVWRVLWPLAVLAAGAFLLWGVKTGRLAGFTQGRSSRPLRRSRADKRILGVCGGIAYYFSVDSALVRVMGIILLVISPFTVMVAYIILVFLIPQE